VNWWNALLAAAVAALFEFSLPVIVLLIVVYVLWLLVRWLVRVLRARRELQRGRAVVAAAIEVARADVARLERRIAGEKTTVRILPHQRDGGE
jgi:flagellar biosynthesis/type III secretory pathway M-ring protein FliF/YscJ